MTKDGRRSAKLTSKDVIDYVETYAEVNHCKLYEAIEDIIRKQMKNQIKAAETQNTYDGEMVLMADKCGFLIDSFLENDYMLMIKKSGEKKVLIRYKK